MHGQNHIKFIHVGVTNEKINILKHHTIQQADTLLKLQLKNLRETSQFEHLDPRGWIQYATSKRR